MGEKKHKHTKGMGGEKKRNSECRRREAALLDSWKRGMGEVWVIARGVVFFFVVVVDPFNGEKRP